MAQICAVSQCDSEPSCTTKDTETETVIVNFMTCAFPTVICHNLFCLKGRSLAKLLSLEEPNFKSMKVVL